MFLLLAECVLPLDEMSSWVGFGPQALVWWHLM